jgi:hypothetical protein
VTRYDRVIVTGTRDALSAEDEWAVERLVRRYVAASAALAVGDCPTGVDALVRQLYPHASVLTADWQRFGKRAGPERNGRLVAWVADGESPIVLAFPSPTSRGTWDCARQAAAAGVRVLVEPVGVSS